MSIVHIFWPILKMFVLLMLTHSAEAKEPQLDIEEWNAEVSVNVRYFQSERPIFSKTGERLFFVTFHGDLVCDCVISEIWVYSVGEIRLALMRKAETISPLAHFKQPSQIRAIAWENEDEITFVGYGGGRASQIFAAKISDQDVHQLTNFTGSGIMDKIIRVENFVWFESMESSKAPEPLYPVQTVTQKMINQQISGGLDFQWNAMLANLSSRDEDEIWRIEGSESFWNSLFIPSSDGQKAIQVRIPKQSNARTNVNGRKIASAGQFMLIDGENRTVLPLLDAPIGSATRFGGSENAPRPTAFWTEGQRYVILVNTALPINENDKNDDAEMAYIVSYDLKTHNWEIIEPIARKVGAGKFEYVTKVKWFKLGQEILLCHEVEGKPTTSTTYSFDSGKWRGLNSDACHSLSNSIGLNLPERRDLSVGVRQSMNEPPKMIAVGHGHELNLSGLDPALQKIRQYRQVPFSWTESNNRVETGGLIIPSGIGPFPLVIQAGEYSPNDYLPDGPGQSAYAAQLLAAHGFAVLSVNIPGSEQPPIKGVEELSIFNDRIKSIMSALTEFKKIDIKRTGIIGFSRGGFNAYHAVIQNRNPPFRAAIIDDSYLGDYTGYLTNNRESGRAVYGGDFWHNKQSWFQQETTFNIDKVQTPVLFSYHSQVFLSNLAPTVGAFKLNRRPMEFVIFPEPPSGHTLTAPKQRLASLELTLEWMRFWLADTVPSDVERAERWKTLRDGWLIQQAWEAAGHPVGSVPDPDFKPANDNFAPEESKLKKAQ